MQKRVYLKYLGFYFKSKLLFIIFAMIFLFPFIANAELPPQDVFIHWWTFDDANLNGASVEDVAGNGSNDGNLVGGFTTGKGTIIKEGVNGTGATSNGVEFNRTGDLEILFANNYTIGICYKGVEPSPSSSNKLWGMRDSVDGQHFVEFTNAADGTIEFCFGDGAVGNCPDSTTSIDDDVSHSIIVMKNGTGTIKGTIWIDGILEGEASQSIVGDTEDKLYLGVNQPARDSSVGLHDEWWIKNGTLTESQIISMANDGNCVGFSDLEVDATLPIINSSFNISVSNIEINDVLNISFNMSDEDALATGNITHNMTNDVISLVANFTLSGTRAEMSNVTTITVGFGSVINFTGYVTDGGGNVVQNSTLITVTDTVFPIINFSINKSTNLQINDIINMSFNISDESGLLSGNVTWNMTNDENVTLQNFSLSGTRGEIYNVSTITVAVGSVINITGYATDLNNNVRQNSTVITIANTPPPVAVVVNTSGTRWSKNETFNWTIPADADGEPVTSSAYYNDTTGNYVFIGSGEQLSNWTMNLTDGTYGLLINRSDATSNVSSAYWNFTLDSVLPTISFENITNLNNTIIAGNLTVGVICSDPDVFNLSVNVSDGSEVFEFKYNDTVDTDSTLGLNLSINMTGITDRNINVTYKCSESHTDEDITSWNNEKDEATTRLNYYTERDNEINLKLKTSDYPICDFGTELDESGQKYHFWFDFSSCNAIDGLNHSYTFKLNSKTTLRYLPNTQYVAHFITDYEGIDFESNTLNDYTIDDVKKHQIQPNQYEINLSTTEGNLSFDSLFGLNIKEATTTISVDNTNPIINSSFNISGVEINDVLNISFNVSDGTSLSTGNITHNMTNDVISKVANFTFSGTRGEMSNVTTITCGFGCVINFTGYVTDEAGLVTQNSTLITITDTKAPVINMSSNISINSSPIIRINDIINMSFNISDESGLLSGNVTWNITDDELTFLQNFSLSGIRGEIYNVSTITVPVGSVINITGYATDLNNNVKQNSTVITITNTEPPTPAIVNTSGTHWNGNKTFNITPVTDADGSTILYTWDYNTTDGGSVRIQSAEELTNWTTNLTDGTYGINVSASDGTINVSSGYWNFTIDSSPPILTIVSPANGSSSTLRSQNITWTVTDSLDFNCTMDVNGILIFNQSNLISGQFSNGTTLSSTNNVINVTCVDSIGNTNSIFHVRKLTTVTPSGDTSSQDVATQGTNPPSTTTDVTEPISELDPTQPINAFLPVIWKTERDTEVNLFFFDNEVLYDPKTILFEFEPVDFFIYKNLTKHSTGNYTAIFYTKSFADESDYTLRIKAISSPEVIKEVTFKVKKTTIFTAIDEFGEARTEDVKAVIAKVTGRSTDKLTNWQKITIGIGILISVFLFLLITVVVLAIVRSGKTTKKTEKALL